MKLPEPLFKIINPLMGLMLRSPIHPMLSKSLMLITFTGRRSHKKFTTPVRYVIVEDTVRCFTSATNQWWRNLRDGTEVELLIRGERASYNATVIYQKPAEVKLALAHYLKLFPQDADYHNISINKDGSLNLEDLDRASTEAVVVEARKVNSLGTSE